MAGGRAEEIRSESREYHQAQIQMVRAVVSESITDYMNGVEITEEWLFERLWMKEDKKLRDPEDVYLEVRNRRLSA